MKTDLATLNQMGQADFVALMGGVYEESPWIAEAAWEARPFASLRQLHQAMERVVANAGTSRQLDLIRAHPDLVGRAAREGRLTAASTKEQAGAGLHNLDHREIGLFEEYNAAYHENFGFPFVICARENKKESILTAFPVRLQNPRDREIATALAEISKIAWFRLVDMVREPSASNTESS